MSTPPANLPASRTVRGALRPFAESVESVLTAEATSPLGLSPAEARIRLERFGANRLPRTEPPGVALVFVRQFLNPLIYILLAAAVVSLFLGDLKDAGFILAVLLINAVIGTAQEVQAERSAAALQSLVSERAVVVRAADELEIDAADIVPGDVVLLESGTKVPCDLRLIDSLNLMIDESLLTGESEAVAKDARAPLPLDTPLAERANMAYAGALVTRGRGRGVAVATGAATQLASLGDTGDTAAKAPLVVRMEQFTAKVGLVVLAATAMVAAVALAQGAPWQGVFFLAVALTVAAIPEGLPVALTVAMAVGTSRMARHHVIVRKLVSVEALGSCTFIASDKTGTLTVNRLTAKALALPGLPLLTVSGEGTDPTGRVLAAGGGQPDAAARVMVDRVARVAALANEATLSRREDGTCSAHGDAADVAMLVLAHKADLTRPEALARFPQAAMIPYEPEYRFAASVNLVAGEPHAFVKGAVERLLGMCTAMATPGGDRPLDAEAVLAQEQELAASGYRVLAMACGRLDQIPDGGLAPHDLSGLTLLGLVGLIDPLRPEAKSAVAACRGAGIEVAMVTGDHPATALAIARELQLADGGEQVVTGAAIAQAAASGPAALEAAVRGRRVFARVEPQQKLLIVQALQRLGHFVAVTGDGANDVPALRAAQVGVAMGRGGTDIARENAHLILTDDDFASIVAGVRHGRITYGNVRKVVFLLIATGAAELLLVLFSLIAGLPLPLLPVQLLWLNLVTNGIQGVALAFEGPEGDELGHPPRRPGEPIFNRLMIERVVVAALFMGVVATMVFAYLLQAGWTVAMARNATLLLMVLFENAQVLNSRSETQSFLKQPLRRNPLLVLGTLAATLLHVGAMYVPWFGDLVGIHPLPTDAWIAFALAALGMLVVMEVHKAIRRFRPLS